MCGIATLTMDVSISSSTAASVTAIAMRYLCLYLSSATACAARAAGSEATSLMKQASARLHVHVHGHTWPQRSSGAEVLGEVHAKRHALHDLREVARGIVRRKKRELGSGRRGDALHYTLRLCAAVRIYFDLDLLAHANVGELR